MKSPTTREDTPRPRDEFQSLPLPEKEEEGEEEQEEGGTPVDLVEEFADPSNFVKMKVPQRLVSLSYAPLSRHGPNGFLHPWSVHPRNSGTCRRRSARLSIVVVTGDPDYSHTHRETGPFARLPAKSKNNLVACYSRRIAWGSPGYPSRKRTVERRGITREKDALVANLRHQESAYVHPID